MVLRVSFPAFLILALVALTAGLAFAQQDLWSPPTPQAAEKDWIKLSSGEWLWGTIDLMRDESLGFDSEELDKVTIDWIDIHEIRSARMMSYVFEDGSVATGTSEMKNDTLKVTTTAGNLVFPRKRISAILEGRPTELNFWSVKLGVDMKWRSGNTDQQDFGSRVFIKREATRSRIDLKYQGNFSETENVETVRNNLGTAEWKIFLSRKFFVTPLKGELYGDPFQNIKLRSGIGVGLGYFLTRGSKTDWYVETGAGYRNTRYESVEPGQDDTQSNGTIPFRTTLETDLTKSIDLTAEYGVQIGLGAAASTDQRVFVLFEFDLLGDLDLTYSFTWENQSRPKTNADGVTPQNNDVTMSFGLAIDF